MTDLGHVLLIGSALLLYVLAAVGLVPFVASEKDRSAVGWALLALLFSPLLALVALAAVPSGTHGEPVSSFDAELRRQ